MWPFATDRVYLGLVAVAAGLAVAAAVVADGAEVSLLSGAVAAFAMASLWREARTQRAFGIGEGVDHQVITESGVEANFPIPVSRHARNVARGTVESWDDETGWGVLSAPELPSGVFAHFAAIETEAEGFRSLRVGSPVSFDYIEAAGGPGSQDGCSYVAERVVQLEE
jgi:CspA family cold shock protein